MDHSSPDYKQLFLQERRIREEAERAQRDAENAREEAERARDRAEEKTRKTSLPEFLDACHSYLYSGLSIQTDVSMSTRGDPSNANEKVRPNHIRVWEDFPAQQEAIWDALVRSQFMQERHFTSVNTLQENGEMVRPRMMSSELDLHHFERSTVHDHISLIISQLHKKKEFRKAFKLEGSVQFENHGNTLSPETDIEEGVQHTGVSGGGRRRSPRLMAQEQSSTTTTQAAQPSGRTRPSRPRADQFCVYNTSGDPGSAGSRIPAFIIEYKPPHKLTLGHIYEGLEEVDLDQVVRCKDTDRPKENFRRLIAAVITQAFSYMVHAGLEFGCVCNGEASIFLRIPEDPQTVLFFVSVPKGDVGDSTGWHADGDQSNRLHLTAVGQMLAFTLQSLRKPPRSHAWRARAVEQLHTWEVVYDDLLEAIPADEVPLSEYRPPKENKLLRVSPIRLRSRRPLPTASPLSCNPQDQINPSDGSDDDGSGPETPSRRARPMPSNPAVQPPDASAAPSTESRTSNPTMGQRYCTQECLRGLLDGGALDKSCPNAHEHGRDRHQISGSVFCTLMRRQLAEDLDANFAPIGLPGSRGVPFRVRLASHGYTLAAKCTPPDFVAHLTHEAAVYGRLRPIQGIHVPVHLGNINLAQPYYYEGIAELTHVMFLSFGGTPIHEHINAANRTQLIEQVESCFHAIHMLDVLHRDAKSRNIIRHEGSGRVMVIDFERAELRTPRPTLGVISPNRKRRGESGLAKRLANPGSAYVRERRLLTAELSALAQTRSLKRDAGPS